jgi:hypothetical protein
MEAARVSSSQETRMSVSFTRRTVAFSFGISAILRSAGIAAADTGKPILTVTGKVGPAGGVAFDREALEKLGLVSVETTTPWHTGKVKFEGVPLKILMKHVAASGSTLQALALNDYSTEIPIEDFEKYNVILALKRDGEYMPVRDKGPLFVVYPYDSDPELKSQKFYSRSAWQVKSLIVK